MIQNINHKSKAFTIIELVTVLVISSIVFSMATLIYLNIQSYFTHLKTQNNDYAEITMFRNYMGLKTYNCAYAYKTGNNLILENYNKDKIEISFQENNVVCYHKNAIDTFNIKTNYPEYYFIWGMHLAHTLNIFVTNRLRQNALFNQSLEKQSSTI